MGGVSGPTPVAAEAAPAGSGAGGSLLPTGSVDVGTEGAPTAHPTSSSTASSGAMCRQSVTEANAKHVDLRVPQAAAQHVEFVEIIGPTDVHAEVVAVVHLDALNVRHDAMQRELGAAAVRIGMRRERARLQHVQAGFDHGLGRAVRR